MAAVKSQPAAVKPTVVAPAPAPQTQVQAQAQKPVAAKPGVGVVPAKKITVMNEFQSSPKKNLIMMIVSIVLVTGAGIATGYTLSNAQGGSSGDQISESIVNTPDEAGIDDEEAYPDIAEGVMTSGGIEGEGTHHLERGEAENQYVYLTSNVIDLGSFEGKKVKVWGQTVAGQSAGWLMKVGRVKVVE